MANKAFEIQESKLRIGGLDLEAGATAIAIPGLSQAATYFVEEVDERDGNNPDTFGNNASNVTVIDNSRYLVLSGTTPSSSYIAAEYSVDELDDGEIDEINVETAGVFESADKTRAEAGNMWATTVANPFVSFNTGDWTQIPYRPKVRAGEITNIGGGGASSLADLDDVQLEGPVDGSVLTWNQSQEKWQNQSLPGGGSSDKLVSGDLELVFNDSGTLTFPGPGGGSDVSVDQETGIFEISTPGNIVLHNTSGSWTFSGGDLKLPAGGDIVDSTGASVLGGGGGGGATNQISSGSYNVTVNSSGVISMATARGGIEFGAMPEVGGPEHLHIMRPAGQDGSTDLFFGDDYNYVKLPGLYGSNPGSQQGVEIGSSLDEGTVSVWKFDTDGSLVFPDGSTQTTAYLTAQQYGYFAELVHTGDNRRADMEAVAMDSDGNSYISYSYYDDNESKRYGGIIKFNSLGVQQWSKNIISGNIDAEYVNIISLEYVVVSSIPTLLALGSYYDDNTSKDVGFTYFIDPADGSIIPTTSIEFTSGNGMSIKDGVFSVDPSGGIVNALVVGETYDENLQKTFTPLAPSTTDKLYVSWTEFNASGVQSGSQLNYTVGGYYNVIMNGTYVTASPDGTGSGLGIQVSAVEGGTYNIIRVNGWSGVISGWTSPQSIRVLGSNLGGVDGVNDFVFDFDPVVFADNSNNIDAAVSNKTGTPISDVFCQGSGGKDWSAEIGNSLSFEYQLNNQAFISRIGGTGWSKNIGLADYDRLHSVVVDTSSGDNYAVGYMWNGNNRGSLVIKHDIAGNQEWAVYVDPANNTGGHVTSVDLLADGNIITVDENGTVTKIDSSDGSIIWQVTIDDNPSWNNEFRGTATPDGGYILTSDEDNDYTLYVARISGNDGSVEWTKRITRTFGGNTGEIGPQNDYDAQYIDCNSTHVTIAANSYLNGASPEYVGIVINFPIDGENTDGIYGQYVISSVTLDWTTESTTSVAATVNTETNNVTNTSVTPTSSSSNLTVGKTNIGGGAEVTPPTSIVNGNSYANIADADGNLVIGVNNDNMTWTFATDRVLYGKTDEHITIAVIDADDDGYGVRQLVVDGNNTEHARTQLERDEFRIGLDFQGDNTSWTFNPTNFQVPSYKDSSIYSFGGNLTLYAMNDGSNGVARLQSVSNMNGPNVFSQFEATPTGANVKVYNGGSNGGTEYVWTFGTDGSLTFPDATVQTTAYTGGGGGGDATGVSRSDDNLIIRLTDPNNDGLELRSIVVNGNDADVASTVLGSNGFIIRTNSNVSQQQWQFGNDGNLTLPAGGTINDSTGASVLGGGGGGTTLPTDASGYLNNNGSGTLTWVAGNPAGSGMLPYTDVVVFSNTVAGDWTSFTLSGTMDSFSDYQNNIATITLSSQTALGVQAVSNTKTLWINDSRVDSNNYMVVEFPPSPTVGDVFNVAITHDQTTVNAGSFVVGQTYTILTVGDTNWTAIGAPYGGLGAVFIATGIGSGTGTATTAAGAKKIIYKPATGQRVRTFTSGQQPGLWFGTGGTYNFMYADASVGNSGMLLTFVFAGTIGGTPSWYQVYF
jgi:hypothetical protein